MKTTGAVLALLLLLLLLSACVPGPNSMKNTPSSDHKPAGFWLGLWQGFLAPIVFVVSLFKPGLNIYEVHNNGGWYNFGYLFGVMCFFGGGGSQRKRKR